ncbi:MAG: hypothetical protein JNL70_03840 [Saprospiraceae bacterium]|nr:hypothetical protein [Saprospiraceae bacterium]
MRNTEPKDSYGKRGAYLVAMGISVVVFLIKFTPHVLNPTHYDWLMSYADCPTEYVSWQFYRNTAWHFPVIGTLEGYDYPTVTGIGLTGAIPLLAIPFKILSPLLPTDFQYFGFWFLACYVLQAYFSVRLLRGVSTAYSYTISPIQLILGSVFFILSPALLTRSGHMNLCAHWLVLWSLCIYFEPANLRQKFFSFLKIVALTALIHQYLLLMVFGLAFATYWKSERIGQKPWLSMTYKSLMNVAGLVVAMILWFFVGNFNTSTGRMTQIGFGKFSANLNTFFNGQDEQLLMPSFAVNEGQYEGQGYLGLGVLLMATILAIVYFFRKKQAHFFKTRFSPLVFITVLFTFFAFSHIFTFSHTKLFEASFFVKNPPFDFLSQAFRSSGRFIWVAHYLLMASVIAHFWRVIEHKLAMGILSFLVLLQISDVSPMVTREHKYYDFDGYNPSVMTSKTWQKITEEAERIVMLPLYTWHYKTNDDYIHFARVAALNHKSITTGYLARPDWDAHAVYEKKVVRSLEKGELGDETNSIFITSKQSEKKLQKLSESGQIKAFTFEDYIVGVPLKFEKTIQYLKQLPNCTSTQFDTEGLAEFLEKNKNETILAVVKDDGAWKLCEEAKVQLRQMGSDIGKLQLRGSMAAIFQNGKLIFEKITPENEAIVQKFKKGDVLNSFTFKNDLELHSAGAISGNFGKVIIDGKDLSLSQRGFNLVILDKDFKVIKRAYFDTFDDCYIGAIK